MKIPDNLKKSSFVNGALFVTICIIITKILGVLYVIPFHAMIGESGGALYGYAYTIYVFFLSISSAGIPLAISKIISEYNTSGNYDARDRAFFLGKRIALIFLVYIVFLVALFPVLINNRFNYIYTGSLIVIISITNKIMMKNWN